MENLANNKIIGVGSFGNNFISSRICNRELTDFNKYAVNTDAKALNHLSLKDKILIGKNITEGLGAGGKPETGEKAAIYSEEAIQKIIEKG